VTHRAALGGDEANTMKSIVEVQKGPKAERVRLGRTSCVRVVGDETMVDRDGI